MRGDADASEADDYQGPIANARLDFVTALADAYLDWQLAIAQADKDFTLAPVQNLADYLEDAAASDADYWADGVCLRDTHQGPFVDLGQASSRPALGQPGLPW
ncbi:MAG: hypothetical protein AB7I37_20405 [Pirellulales bacterium]